MVRCIVRVITAFVPWKNWLVAVTKSNFYQVLGLIHSTYGEYVIEVYGADAWAKILSSLASVHPLPKSCSEYVSACPFPDNIMYNIIDATCEVVKASAYDIGRGFGQHFVKVVLKDGYGKILRRLGRNLPDFLANLNNLHLHLSLGMPAMVAPDFRVEKLTSNSVELHYRSKRPGLMSWVVGLIEAVAEHLYKHPVHLKLLKGRDDGSCDHEVWSITFPERPQYLEQKAACATLAAQSMFVPEAALFWKLFPFHMVLDANLNMVQVGEGLQRHLNMRAGSFKLGCPVADHFQIQIPYTSWDFEELAQITSQSTCFVLTSRLGMQLKGGWYLSSLPDGSQALLFAGSPRLKSLEELELHGMFLSDIPPHDMSSDFVVVAEERGAEAEHARQLQVEVQAALLAQQQVEQAHAALKREQEKTEALLQRQYELIAVLGKVASVGRSETNNAAAQELLDGVRQRISQRPQGGQGMQLAGGDKVEVLELLGEGSFGKVYKGLWRGQVVAVKSMVMPRNMSSTEKHERMAIMEAAISSSLSHPNIVQTYTYSLQPIMSRSNSGTMGPASSKTNKAAEGARSATSKQVKGPPSGGDNRGTGSKAAGVHWSDEQAVQAAQEVQAVQGHSGRATAATSDISAVSNCSSTGSGGHSLIHSLEVRIVLEFCDCGNLRAALDRRVFKRPSGEVDYTAVLDTAVDVAGGLFHLHASNVVHADVKALNVLLRSSASDPRGFTAKVADFGLSFKMDTQETHISRLCQGTLTHMAPEILLEGHQSKAADVYSFGILMWEMYTGSRAFQGMPQALLGYHITHQKSRPTFPPDTPTDYVALAQRCWDTAVGERPSFEHILGELTDMRRKAMAAAGADPMTASHGSSLLATQGGTPLVNEALLDMHMGIMGAGLEQLTTAARSCPIPKSPMRPSSTTDTRVETELSGAAGPSCGVGAVVGVVAATAEAAPATPALQPPGVGDKAPAPAAAACPMAASQQSAPSSSAVRACPLRAAAGMRAGELPAHRHGRAHQSFMGPYAAEAAAAAAAAATAAVAVPRSNSSSNLQGLKIGDRGKEDSTMAGLSGIITTNIDSTFA